MSAFPHVYTTTAKGRSKDHLTLTSEGLPSLQVTAPPQFKGPEGYWSPETFFSATVSTCFILTFRFVSQAMKLSWNDIVVDVDAYLDKAGAKLSFTKVEIFVTLTVPREQSADAAVKALEKAKESCLITNSISSEIQLHTKIVNEG